LNRTACFQAAIGLLLLSSAFVVAPITGSAQDEPNPELIKFISDLMRDPELEMRALGLQQIREEAPGEAATKQFCELLPSLPAEVQAALLEALGDRGDVAARPSILSMLESKEDTVRAAALGAIGALGGADDVPLLAEKSAKGSPPEQTTATTSLVRLRGDEINPAIVAAAEAAAPEVRAKLLTVLGRRNAKETLPTVLAAANTGEPAVRLAALGALRLLAEPKDMTDLLQVLKTAEGAEQRHKALLALLAVCNRGRETCVEPLNAAIQDADAATKIVLIHALARAGGDAALQSIVALREDRDDAVRDEAVRVLAVWPDKAVAPQLFEIAASDNPRHQVVALRGLVRLAGPQGDQPADTAMLTQALPLAKRVAEQRMVLSALGGSDSMDALDLVLPWLQSDDLSEEAALAVVGIASRLGGQTARAQEALQQVLATSKNPLVRERAEKILETP